MALSTKQQKALEALLSGASDAAAAAAAGVVSQTVWTWRNKHPEFAAELDRLRDEHWRMRLDAVNAGATAAIAIVTEIMNDTTVNPHTRLAAAGKLLDLAFKGRDMFDLAKRVELLEDYANVKSRT